MTYWWRLLFMYIEKFEDTERVIRSRKWNGRQCNGQKKGKDKSPNNDLQNTIKKTKD
jgi:hypothetical protein